MSPGKHLFIRSFVAIVLGGTVLPAQAAVWPMKQRDMAKTGRADYVVPASRLNGTFFNFYRWQKPAPGPLSTTSMSFFDGSGPAGADVVVGGYHWPKGVQGMDRHTGRLLWNGNPAGGETIGTITPAFSNDGATVYVVNDSTASETWPAGHPLMAFSTLTGPASYWHNGGDPDPEDLSMHSPTIAPDGRIFLHRWVDRPYAGSDSGTAISRTWAAAVATDSGYSDPALYLDGEQLLVVIGGRDGYVYCFDGDSGALLWATEVGATIDASPTIDPVSGKIYVGCGSDDIRVAGLDRQGNALWSSLSMPVFEYQLGVNEPQRAQSAGCLSHDGSTYYFQTNSPGGQGRLYAVNTADGTVRWSYPTQSRGWEMHSSSPIVTTNGVIIVGNNDGDTYFALHDQGGEAALLDTLDVDPDGNARASATLSPEGLLYLPARVVWVVSNGDGDIPGGDPEDLFCAFDLTANPQVQLPPPPGQIVEARNGGARISWLPVYDPGGAFDHYAIYRDTAPFTSVVGKTPIGQVASIGTTSYLDTTATNGVAYYYAVTSVAVGGAENRNIGSIGPRTPYAETDLQVACIARTPRFPRYDPLYTGYEITEPSGFGPYLFTAATGLGSGQTGATPRWPAPGQTVTYTASVRNRGTNPWSGNLTGQWSVDGVPQAVDSQNLTLAPGEVATFSFARTWDGSARDITFQITNADARPGNNSLTVNTRSVAFLSYIDVTRMETFREETASYPSPITNDFIDWLNAHMVRFNQMFAAAGCGKRVHFDVLQVLRDTDPDPAVARINFAIFPFRYRHNEGSLRLSGYYWPPEDLDYGLLHEMGHQLGLIDIYQLNLPPDRNQVSGLGYSGPACLMNGVSRFLSSFSARAMQHWLDKAHGYYGQFMYAIPAEIRLRILGYNGQPLPGATVKMYQMVDRPGQGPIITTQLKAQGTTDASGHYVLPNVDINESLVPPTHAGDTLNDNPFGYLAVVGNNGLLHFRVEYNGGVDYAWLDITECNLAYWQGQTALAVFDRLLGLGGPLQILPPDDMTELNADAWSAWAEGSNPQNTYTADDTVRRQVGQASVKFVTDGGFDTYLRYPRNLTARWDLSCASVLRMRVYAENLNFGFQSGSPWIRLKDADNNYFLYQYYQNGEPVDLLNTALNQWVSWQIPLNASATENNGWRRTASGSPTLSHMQYLEIHADTWGNGFTLWLDGVGFDVPGRTPADRDGDCDVDGSDVQAFVACFTGGDVPQTATGCQWADFEADGDVDQRDFGLMQRCFSGSGLPADPRCAP